MRAGNYVEALEIVTKQFKGAGDTGVILEPVVKEALQEAIKKAQQKQDNVLGVTSPLSHEKKLLIWQAAKDTRSHHAPRKVRDFAKLVLVVLDLNFHVDGGNYESEFEGPFQDTFEWIWLKLVSNLLRLPVALLASVVAFDVRPCVRVGKLSYLTPY